MSNSKVRKGIVVKDQGFVPYNAPKTKPTPDVAKGKTVSGQSRGMGGAERGGKFTLA